MTDLWTAAASMDLSQFMALRDAFVSRRGEMKRECDAFYPESFSCLHKVNPNMVPMTFHGMRMLDRLWAAGCAIPPLKSTNGDATVLLEAMPGAVLRVFKLPFKGYKNGANAMGLRRRILDGLPKRSGLSLPNLDEYRDLCMSSHDGLDAVVAAIAAALWVVDPLMFRHPPVDGETLQLEGWLYAPTFIDLPAS
jgi:hypothetical protein